MALSMTSSSNWTLPKLQADRFELFEAGVRTTLAVRCPLAITFLDGTNKPPSKDELAECFDIDGRLGLFMTGGSIAGDTAKPFPMSSNNFGKSAVSAVITTSGAVVEKYDVTRIQAILDYTTLQDGDDDPSGGAGNLPSLAGVGKASNKAAGGARRASRTGARSGCRRRSRQRLLIMPSGCCGHSSTHSSSSGSPSTTPSTRSCYNFCSRQPATRPPRSNGAGLPCALA